MVNFTLPADSPLWSPHLYRLLLISLLIQHTIWHVLANTILKGPHNLKKRSWILTTLAAFVMTGASLPYLKDLFLPPDSLGLGAGLLLRALNLINPVGNTSPLRRYLATKAIEAAHANAHWEFFSLAQIQLRTYTVTHPLCMFFIAYLLSDLFLGAIFYPTMMNIASGWVHHTAYTFFFSFWIHRGWGHIAATAAVMELPTGVMGIACLYPPLRSNMGFTISFFATRVFLHFGILCAVATKKGRYAPGIDGSLGPLISVAVIYPMHLYWGYKCILSVRRRMRKRALSEKSRLEEGLAARDAARAKLLEAADLQSRRKPTLAEHLRLQLPQLAANAGRFFNGLAPPDTTSALNTPALTPTGGASPMLASFGASAPVAVLSKAARAAADRLGRRKRSSSSITGSLSEAESESSEPFATSSAVKRRASLPGSSKRHSTGGTATSTPFVTAAVVPSDAGPDAFNKTPFLAIRSQAETTDRARRLVADALRKAWNQRAPESWKREWEEEERRDRKERAKRAKRRADAVKAKKAAKEQAAASSAVSSKRGSRAQSQRASLDGGARLSLDGTTDVGEVSTPSSFESAAVDEVEMSAIFEDALDALEDEDFAPASYTDAEDSAWSGFDDDVSVFHLDESSTENHDEDLDEEAAEAAALSKMDRRKAAARRAIIRAVRRAINGREPTSGSDLDDDDDDLDIDDDEEDQLDLTEDVEGDASDEDEQPIDENDFFAQAARQQRRAERAEARAKAAAAAHAASKKSKQRRFFERTLANLDWNAFVKLLPAEFSRDQDSFVVRELQVERASGAGERRKRMVADLRRRLEVARRDVVVCD
ncbi:hypothetical protein OC846_005280 [Tilletia horrida]|uniref:TLC domain-containing protein n=1 Tax=Tilletia horrida TaxID=155126 RepID=A0AAN6GNS5_9BASI|nr:hypothetical protein OC846_005280 [Tilletia horrida]KAK0551038.1 hypothetical protein OC845_002393 [Tilletia horrida]KAK0570154.1 hypothetical protein OC861_000296 [Tilletia horrida]